MISFNANKPVRPEDAAGHGAGASVKVATGVYTLSGPLTAGQTIPMVALPTNARVLDILLSSDKLDTGAGLALDVGDKALNTRYFNASDLGRTGGIARLALSQGHGYRYAKADTVNVTVKTAPAAQAADGSFTVTVYFVID